jgi:hypothetical protein
MKTNSRVLIVAGMLVFALLGCAPSRSTAWRQGTTTLKVSGAPGTRITGFYIRDGKHYDITNSLPFTLTETGLSEVEIRKASLQEVFTVETRYEDPERLSSFANMVAPPGVAGVRVELRHGFSVEHLKK